MSPKGIILHEMSKHISEKENIISLSSAEFAHRLVKVKSSDGNNVKMRFVYITSTLCLHNFDATDKNRIEYMQCLT